MSEEMIYSIIDDIAHDAKVIISEHLHPGLVKGIGEALEQSAKDWEDANEKMARVFRDLEDDVRKYFDDNGCRIAEALKEHECDYAIGDEVYYISGGCVVRDKVKDIKLYTEGGKWLNVGEVFHSTDELVEHLKKNVHG